MQIETLTPSFFPSKDVLCEQMNDEVVLLDMRSGTYFGLSPVASQFWMALQAGQNVDDARQALLAEFDVPADVLARDIAALVSQLERTHLIERAA